MGQEFDTVTVDIGLDEAIVSASSTVDHLTLKARTISALLKTQGDLYVESKKIYEETEQTRLKYVAEGQRLQENLTAFMKKQDQKQRVISEKLALIQEEMTKHIKP